MESGMPLWCWITVLVEAIEYYGSKTVPTQRVFFTMRSVHLVGLLARVSRWNSKAGGGLQQWRKCIDVGRTACLGNAKIHAQMTCPTAAFVHALLVRRDARAVRTVPHFASSAGSAYLRTKVLGNRPLSKTRHLQQSVLEMMTSRMLHSRSPDYSCAMLENRSVNLSGRQWGIGQLIMNQVSSYMDVRY